MQRNDTWLLPEGIEEILPQEARSLENLRHRILDLFKCWGYEQVIPPMIDFLDSLLTGSGHDLDLQTFKLVDQVSGKTLGFRADMTPQVARIDAHRLMHDSPNRLCYAGTVLHTRGDALEKTRSPMQIGAELYGHAGIDSDFEVIRLMLEMLALSGLLNVHLDLGHVGVFRALSNQAELNKKQESDLFDILQRKAGAELSELVTALPVNDALKTMLISLPQLNGGREVLTKAKQLFAAAGGAVIDALTALGAIADKLEVRYPHLPVSFDLAELRGYHYHTGIVFAAFVPQVGKEIARGGRYDNIGSFFGRARPATGFSADLKVLSQLNRQSNANEPMQRIFAPEGDDSELIGAIRDFRAQGCCVIQQLPGQQGDVHDTGCNALLVHNGVDWVIKNID
jgi:ATP phosphoribosyltransferase regulatory subunit